MIVDSRYPGLQAREIRPKTERTESRPKVLEKRELNRRRRGGRKSDGGTWPGGCIPLRRNPDAAPVSGPPRLRTPGIRPNTERTESLPKMLGGSELDRREGEGRP